MTILINLDHEIYLNQKAIELLKLNRNGKCCLSVGMQAGADPKPSDSCSGYWSPAASIGSAPSPPRSSTMGGLTPPTGQPLVGASSCGQPLSGLPLELPMPPSQCRVAEGWIVSGGTKRQQGERGEDGKEDEGEGGSVKKRRGNSGDAFTSSRGEPISAK